MSLEHTSNPLSEDIDFLTQKINQSAYVLSHYGVISHDEALAKADGSIYTDQLWVHPAHRNNGLGHQLMEAVHDYGRKSGCRIATVATMSFHLPALYELRQTRGALDFACPAVALKERRRKRPGYTQNSSCYFMRKEL